MNKRTLARGAVILVPAAILACVGVAFTREPDPLEPLFQRATQKGETVMGANPRVRMQSLRIYGAKYEDVKELLLLRFPPERGFRWEVGPWVKGSQVTNIERASDQSSALVIHFLDTQETYIERIEPMSDADYWRLWVRRLGKVDRNLNSSISRKP